MPDKDRQQFEEQLRAVNKRLAIVDMIEERLLKMRTIAEEALSQSLTTAERAGLAEQMKNLNQQVWMLNNEAVGE